MRGQSRQATAAAHVAIPAAQESTSEGEGREGSPGQGGRAGGEAESEAGSGLMEEEDGKKDCAREKRFFGFFPLW